MNHLYIRACILLYIFTAFTTILSAQRIHPGNPYANTALHPSIGASRAPSPQPFAPTVGTVNPIPLGMGYNVLYQSKDSYNQVVAVDSLNLVAFVHRSSDSTAPGLLAYDVSTDRGLSWATHIGPLLPDSNFRSSFPNLSVYSPPGNSVPSGATFVWAASQDSVSASGYPRQGFGTAAVQSSGSPAIWQDAPLPAFSSQGAHSLVQGRPGEFWAVDIPIHGFLMTDSLLVYRGIFDTLSQSLNWSIHSQMVLPHDISFDGYIHAMKPQIAFSPDGNVGWIGLLGNLVGGNDTAFHPIFIRSTDGGMTWGNPMEVNLDSIRWVSDSLQTLWVNSSGQPYASGKASIGFDFDMTVDHQGEVHLASVILPDFYGYAMYTGLAKFLADVHSTGGGADFDIHYVAPILTFRGDFGSSGSGGYSLVMDNFVQVSRNEAGTHVFYSWVDSDTLVVGFGITENLAPNLRISGLRVDDGYRTCYKKVTDGDLLWDGLVLNPSMAPVCLNQGSHYQLPIVFVQMVANDPLKAIQFHYLGNDATFEESDFYPPSAVILAWPGCFIINLSPALEIDIEIGLPYPNPSANQFTLPLHLGQAGSLEIALYDLSGRMLWEQGPTRMWAGDHLLKIPTTELPSGLYYMSVKVDGHRFGRKIQVQ